ncbi:MAG: sigma-70 family RNA polymerase sigma factor, partial [Saprospiraceae bacterium]|nr:sigma-70 family RNA polymerase sigma factor [Saprospiraceae bacterium]
DILQNVFVKAYKAIAKFEGKSKLSTWLFRIATNETLSFLKKQKIKVVGSETNENMLNQVIAEPHIEGDQIIELLQKAISVLPEKQKLVFSMRYFDEMSYADISQVLNVTTGGLKASFHHAVKKIEVFVKENQEL